MIFECRETRLPSHQIKHGIKHFNDRKVQTSADIDDTETRQRKTNLERKWTLQYGIDVRNTKPSVEINTKAILHD
jgi:hypothetical protein